MNNQNEKLIPERGRLLPAEEKVLDAFRAGDAKVPVEIGAKVRGNFLRGLFLGNYDEKADYRGTCIVGAVISGVLDMEFCETKFPVRFFSCEFAEQIKMQQLKCPELDFDGCIIKRGINAKYVEVGGDMGVRSRCDGGVNLSGAMISGRLVCIGGNFQNAKGWALFAQDIKAAKGVRLDKFTTNGQVILAGADIGGQLVCNGGSFQNAGSMSFFAQDIKVAKSVFLNYGFVAKGPVNLLGADIRGSLWLGLGKKCQLTQLVLAGANVSGQFKDTPEVYYKSSDAGGLSKSNNPIALDIDGFRYGRLADKKSDKEFRIKWAGFMSNEDNKFVPQPYEQLMKVYREMGHINWVREVGFALEEKRRKAFDSRWWKSWYWLLCHTIGYGYKPFRILKRCFIPLIFIGTVLFGAASFLCTNACQTECEEWHCMVPSKAKHYPQFNPVYYVVEVVIPVLPLGQTENWRPQTICGGVIQGLMTIIGALALAIFAAYSVNILGPRGRDR